MRKVDSLGYRGRAYDGKCMTGNAVHNQKLSFGWEEYESLQELPKSNSWEKFKGKLVRNTKQRAIVIGKWVG